MKKLFIAMMLFNYLFSSNIEKVSVQLMWLDQFQFAGFYMAKEKGFYKDLDIEVELKKFDNSINVIDEVIENRADFGVTSTSLIVDRANKKDVVLLGAVFQTSPLMLLSIKDREIKEFEDIKDKRLMITKEQSNFATLKAMLISKNMSLDNLQLLKHSLNIDDLINQKTDLMLSYTTNEPFLLKEKGYESKIIYPKDYGFDFYEGLIFTTNSLLKNNPTLVNNFYGATIRGWEYAFENIEESVDLIYNKYNAQNKSKEALLFEANEMKKLVFDENNKIGTISRNKINLITNTYKLMGLIKDDLDLDTFIYQENSANLLNLSKEEINYLKNKKNLTVCSHTNLLPFEAVENKKHIGVVHDYLDYISQSINTPIILTPTSNWHESFDKVVKNECDFLSTIASKNGRTNLLNFTKPYINFPFVIATDIKSPFIDDINNLKGKKIALVKDFMTSRILKERYKNIEFVDVKNLNEGLKAVQKGEVFAAIDSLAVIGYEIQNNFLGELKVSGKIDEEFELFMATNIENKILASILDKSLDKISNTEKQEFLNKWISINYQERVDYRLLAQISTAIFILFLIIFLIYRASFLRKMNDKLEEIVAQEIKKSEEKNQILMQQSKMAAMGEMLENIAHQWRQPLSTISICSTGMKLKKEINSLSDEEFYSSLNHIKNSVLHLTNTIDDFRGFLNHEKTVSNISMRNTISKVIELLKPSLINHNIEIIYDFDDFEFKTLENELIQSLMNIIANAKDALKEKSIPRYIQIVAKKDEKSVEITIKDNAFGIEEKIIDRIFEPYFTTKHKSQGTGIGLYMTKSLIENHLNGSIKVSNSHFFIEDKEYIGACFNIVIPNSI